MDAQVEYVIRDARPETVGAFRDYARHRLPFALRPFA